jgi:hypothetical protein
MKGPGYKLTHDVRRTWRCPACGRERKLPGDVTSLVCECKPDGTFMVISVERTVAPRPFQVIKEHDVRSCEFGIDDMPVLQPHPSSLPPEPTSPRRPRPGAATRVSTARPEPGSPLVDEEPTSSAPEASMPNETPPPPSTDEPEDDWGEGIL